MSAERVTIRPDYTFDLAGAMVAWPEVPKSILSSLQLYVEHRLGPGHFLRAVLENDLQEAFNRSGRENDGSLRAIVAVVQWYVPHIACGSPARVRAWLNRTEKEASNG